MKKIVFILMPKDYRDEEFYIPYDYLSKKYSVDVAGLTTGVAVGVNGYKHTPNLLLEKISDKDLLKYDALVIPGGPGSTKYLWNNKKIQNIVRYFNEHNKIVAAICYGAIAPVEAGILSGKEATVYPSAKAKAILKNFNVTFVDKGVVALENEKIITSQGPKFTKEFSEAIAKFLG